MVRTGVLFSGLCQKSGEFVFVSNTFSSNSKLVAHYQRSSNSFSLDFASFPGPIFISKSTTPKIDVIRGQIYSSSKYPSFGIARIKNNDFSELIDYALKSKGFDENIFINSFNIGYDLNEINLKLSEIVSLFNKKEISHILIIGLFDKFSSQNDYISSLVEKAPKDCYIISFAQNFKRDNFWFVNSFLEFKLTYTIVEYLKNSIDNFSKNVSVFFADCSTNLLSHVFNLIYLDVSKIYLGPCCPNIINPIVFGCIRCFSR